MPSLKHGQNKIYPLTPNVFARPIGRALIEARPPPPGRSGQASFARPIGRALIEAVPGEPLGFAVAGFARPIGRALIEANRSNAAGHGDHRCLHGQLAVPSLKHAIPFPLFLLKTMFARPIGRALIEAVYA